ncbi:histone lysine methyltransferase Set9 [Rhodotorula sphaerocarpa]
MSTVSTAHTSKAFLSQCDDLLTRLILDYSVFGVPKLNGRATGKIEDPREPRMTDREVEQTRELVQQLRKGAIKVDDALAIILKLTPVVNFIRRWEKDEDALGLVANHAKRYIIALRPDSGISFHETDRYKNPRGGKAKKGKKPLAFESTARRDPATFIEVGVFATRDFKKGEVVNLRGGVADLTEQEDNEMRGSGGRRDFSVLWSERKHCFCLLLGPARFVNHDCRNNVEFQLVGANMTFRVLEDIAKDEEIFTHYGDHYFDMNNAECLCATCEQLSQGAFAPKKKVAAATAPKSPTRAPTAPSRRSSRSAALITLDYNESRAQSAPIASGSGHSATAPRSVSSTSLGRSSSMSALSAETGATQRSTRPRPPSSRVVPSRGEISAVEALRNKPRGVIQPKLPPPPGYADDYEWDPKKRIARYKGPVTCIVDSDSRRKKRSSGLSRSASAPSLGKRKREKESNSPAPKSRSRAAEAPTAAKKSRISQIKLKAARLGQRMSSRLTGATTSASAIDRRFAALDKVLGKEEGAEESDLSSLEDDDEPELGSVVGKAGGEAVGDPSSDEEAEDAAVEEQLLTPQRQLGSVLQAGTPTPAEPTTASVSQVVSSASRLQSAPAGPLLVEDNQTTSTPVEENSALSLREPSETGEVDQIILCPMPAGPVKANAPLLSPAAAFYAATAATGVDALGDAPRAVEGEAPAAT